MIWTPSVKMCINRIRLEFKAYAKIVATKVTGLVLIESDWNLKFIKASLILIDTSINRIRLEFKVI